MHYYDTFSTVGNDVASLERWQIELAARIDTSMQNETQLAAG